MTSSDAPAPYGVPAGSAGTGSASGVGSGAAGGSGAASLPGVGPGAAFSPAGGPAAAPVTVPGVRGKPRRARLVVRRVDPWSVLKFALVFSFCLLIVFVVAVAALYYALDALEVFDSLNEFLRGITQAPGADGEATGGIEGVFSAGRIIGGAVVIGLINVVIITAISTLGAFLYNLCADIVGGIEVTLAERD